ncbi:MAG: glucokinase [Deltaproteobacteria bacterium]|nr:glucokinase [Deltaproteobacteria bacterium]
MGKLVLAGDIGATKTNLGLFREGSQGLARVSFCNFASCGEKDFVRQTKAFLVREKAETKLMSVCFGVAGPVCDGSVEATNLGLKLNEKELQREFACARLSLVNDLFATAAAIALLQENNLAVLQEGEAFLGRSATSVVLAPGTGLGMAFMIGGEDQLRILASEGGHADFAPRNEDEIELWRYLKRRFGRVSRERLLSGPGLLNIYDWLRQRPENKKEVALAAVQTSAAQIVAAAAVDYLAGKALATFVALLGSVAGDLAMTGLAAGGLYLAGGIPVRIIDHLRHERFLAAFHDKGRMVSWLKKVPVKVVLDPEAALLGAARIAVSASRGQLAGTPRSRAITS